MKIFVLFYCFRIITSVNQYGNLTMTKLLRRKESVCVNGCFSKCCPLGMGYYKKKGCITLESEDIDFVLNYTQPIHLFNKVIHKASIVDIFKILYGLACEKKYVLNNPFFLQKVSCLVFIDIHLAVLFVYY